MKFIWGFRGILLWELLAFSLLVCFATFPLLMVGTLGCPWEKAMLVINSRTAINIGRLSRIARQHRVSFLAHEFRE